MVKRDRTTPAKAAASPAPPHSPPSRDTIVRRRAAFELLVAECKACRSTVDAHWQFCVDCGSRLSTECPGCGEPLPPLGAKFCGHCGLQIPRLE
ncbi:MAG: zinc ribbon domain-containing protein [Dehalococcoidia bacterium]|nr:zinc ribbon domain-containing protein [Dehalococcoidia bacterium]